METQRQHALDDPTRVDADDSTSSAPIADHDRVLEAIHDSHADLIGLASRLGLSLNELGLWMTDRQNSAKVDGLLRLEDARLQMMLNHYRRAAAANLVRIANAPEPGELARKACVDILRMEIGPRRARNAAQSPSAKPARPGEPNASLNAPSVEAILAELQRLGDADETAAVL